jgi:hypothetical protein
MSEEKDVQAQPGQTSTTEQKKAPTFDELYSKGWEEIDRVELSKGEDEKPPMQRLKEEECPDCPGGKFYKVIKHNGKDVGIKTEKEYQDYVQQGFDYTKKTQALAEERRKLEAERETGKSEYQKLLDRLERLEKGSTAKGEGDNGKARTAEALVDTPEAAEAKVYEEYGLDPTYASDFEKKLVKKVVALDRDSQGAREITQMIVLRDMTKTISNALADAVKEYPVEDILDEKGENVTGQQVISTFRQVVTDPANQKTPVGELARIAVRKVHEAQQIAKGGPAVDDENMSREEFAKKFPKLAAKYLKETSLEGQDDLPPSFTTRKADVPVTEQRGKPKFKGLSEAIDAGLDDPEVKALFGG